MNRLFVIAVASEKGGVGKTTIATNLAVYLKALREDLPVTIASFDNHFTVDQMFALGSRPERSVAGLMESADADELVNMGQYGVQYIASERRLQQPETSPGWLRGHLRASHFSGILILDTRPIFDWFSEAAVLAADLVLVPVKDRAALVNANTFREVLQKVGRADQLWLLPSLVDTRARLNNEVRVHEFLSFSARERDYQILDFCISKSPKVEGLASGFSSRIHPVLTHARNTAVHGQLTRLGKFVLSRFDSGANESITAQNVYGQGFNQTLPDVRRLRHNCPCCSEDTLSGSGHLYLDLRSRWRGFIHQKCLGAVMAPFQPEHDLTLQGLLVLTIDGPGLVGSEARAIMHWASSGADGLESSMLEMDHQGPFCRILERISGRDFAEAYRELILIDPVAHPVDLALSRQYRDEFALERRRILRELRSVGSI